MTLKKKRTHKEERSEGTPPTPPDDAGPSPLIEQARTFGAIADQAYRECEMLGDAEQRMQRRRNASGE